MNTPAFTMVIEQLKLKELEANLTPVGYQKVVVAFEKELIDSQNSKPQSLPKK